jgi:hypothetical protein
LSALLPFVAGAANDWIEPILNLRGVQTNGSLVPIAGIPAFELDGENADNPGVRCAYLRYVYS